MYENVFLQTYNYFYAFWWIFICCSTQQWEYFDHFWKYDSNENKWAQVVQGKQT